MATLIIKPSDIYQLTSLGGNIDNDSIAPHIYTAQITELKRVLGVPLYNKILADYDADTLAGSYLELYQNFIVDLVGYYTASIFIGFGGYKIENAGIFKATAENGQVVDLNETEIIISRYRQLASNIELTMFEYLKTANIPEYGTDEQSKQDNINIIPWY